MAGINIRPDQAAAELWEFSQKLTHGFQNLLHIDGIPTGVTEKEAIYTEDKMVLYRFKSPFKNEKTNPRPLLVVYALVNRPYMADLQENRSMIRGLLEQGQDVYLIDWGYPDRADRYLMLDDYINGYINRCVNILRKKHKTEAVNLLGICQGGCFSLAYAALHPHKVKNLIAMVTPVDFHTPDNMLSHWVKHVDIDTLVDTMGNIPGDLLNWTFLTLKPFRLIGQKYIDMVNLMDDDIQLKNFMRMEKWIFDSPDQVGETYRQFIKEFYQQNLLIQGKVKIGERMVDLKNITMPVLNIYAEDDHLVPPSASKPLKQYVGTKDYTELSFKGGHIGIYVSGGAQKLVPPSIGKWLNSHA